MELYAGIDLHSNDNVLVVLDESDRVIYQKRLPNVLADIVAALASCQSTIKGVAVESTYNWYWLVDGLQEGDTPCIWSTRQRSNNMTGSSTAATSATQGTWRTCCGWGYCRRATSTRAKRALCAPYCASAANWCAIWPCRPAATLIKCWQEDDIEALALLPEQKPALQSNLALMHCLDEHITKL